MSNKKRERFGRYLLLDHLVDGGMAKICRARFLGEQADKVVALKMVQPRYSNDEAYKKMFMDEIKVTFGLIHPNIVQTYDYGFHQDQLYVAMEYCDGRNLKEYLEKLKNRKFVFPVEISTYITSQICQGLHYAHTYEDKLTGKASKIIHRDISPHNIMLTFDGSIKIIDFGIAKSKVNVENTQAGTIKGKLSYLAPEYLEGMELDPRYDLFAAGITLWEMLCSRKLFKAKNDLAVLKKIQECRIPAPSSINPNVPKELDEIVLKALSKNRERRFKNMDQFNRELMKFLYSHYPEFNATDLAYFAKELFKEEIAEDRACMHEFGKIDIQPYLQAYYGEMGSSNAVQGSKPELNLEGAEISANKKTRDLDFGFEGEDPNHDKTNVEDFLEKSITMQSKNPLPHNRNKTRSRIKNDASRLTTRHTKLLEKDKESGMKVNIIAVSVALLAFLVFHKRKDLGFEKLTSGNSSKEVVKVSEKEKSAQRKFGILSLKNVDSTSQKIYVNGDEQSLDVFGELKLKIDQSYTLRVQAKNRKDFIKKFKLSSASPTLEVNVPMMEEARYGYLVTSRECIKGKIFYELYGEKREATLPISEQDRIAFPLKSNGDGRTPAAMSYTVEYHIQGEDFKRKTEFTVNQEADLIDFCDYLNFNN